MTGDVMRHVMRLELALLLAMAAAPALGAEPEPMATQVTAALPALPPAAAPAPLPESFAPEETAQPGEGDGKVHGMVVVGVGTGGYREAAMALHGQLANGAEVAIAVDTVQMGGGRAHRDRTPF